MFADDARAWKPRSRGANLSQGALGGVSELWVRKPARRTILWRLRDGARERHVLELPGGHA
jgi:hypothetical protein